MKLRDKDLALFGVIEIPLTTFIGSIIGFFAGIFFVLNYVVEFTKYSQEVNATIFLLGLFYVIFYASIMRFLPKYEFSSDCIMDAVFYYVFGFIGLIVISVTLVFLLTLYGLFSLICLLIELPWQYAISIPILFIGIIFLIIEILQGKSK